MGGESNVANETHRFAVHDYMLKVLNYDAQVRKRFRETEGCMTIPTAYIADCGVLRQNVPWEG